MNINDVATFLVEDTMRWIIIKLHVHMIPTGIQ